MTKAQLEEKLEKANELIKQQSDLIVKLQYENSAILAGNGVVSKKEFDTVVKDLEHSKEAYRVTSELLDKKESVIEKARAAIQKQQEEIEKMNEYTKKIEEISTSRAKQVDELLNKLTEAGKEIKTLEELKVNNEQVKIKNERNAGRKKSANMELIQKLRAEGKTQEQVARELNISLSTVRRNEK